jgi:hypothetical protein
VQLRTAETQRTLRKADFSSLSRKGAAGFGMTTASPAIAERAFESLLQEFLGKGAGTQNARKPMHDAPLIQPAAKNSAGVSSD